ncbi:putative transcription factor B3-Domain family [Helianthus debilis subsp. tardiflorus]
MSRSCVVSLEKTSSLKLVVPIDFVKNIYGVYWQRKTIIIHHISGKSWPVSLRSVSGECVITDGWSNVVRDLQLPNITLLRLRVMEDQNMEIDCFIQNICGESFVTVNRYGSLNIIVIPDDYVTTCYTYSPVNDYYNIYAEGKIWKVETERINDNYVLTKGCPKLFHDLGIEDDDILLLMKMDSVTFELKIYRKGVEIARNNKEESEEDSLLEIPRDSYYKSVDFNFSQGNDSKDQEIAEVKKKFQKKDRTV